MKYGDPQTKIYLWNKLEKVLGKSPRKYRFLDGNTVSYDELDVDHIIPRSRGGSDDLDNLRLLHYKINIRKSDKIDDSNREAYFDACVKKLGGLSNDNVYKGHLKKGLLLNVKQTPKVGEMPAKIINVNRREKKVEVQFLDRNCNEFIYYDKRLFLNMTSGTRNNNRTTNCKRRSVRSRT